MTTSSGDIPDEKIVSSTGILIISGFEHSPSRLSATLSQFDDVSEVDLHRSGAQITVNIQFSRSKTTIQDLIDLAEQIPGYAPQLQGSQVTPIPTVMISLLPPGQGGRSLRRGFRRKNTSTRIQNRPRTTSEVVTPPHEIESPVETTSSVESNPADSSIPRNSTPPGQFQAQTTKSAVAIVNDVANSFEGFAKGVTRRAKFVTKVLLRITRIISAAIFVLVNSIFGSDQDNETK